MRRAPLFYRILLVLAWPRRVRRDEGRELETIFVHRLDDARRRGHAGVASAWLRGMTDIVAAGVYAHITRRGAAYPTSNETPVVEGSHAEGRGSILVADLRYALRTAARHPGFSLILVVTLALGIGATTAIFSVINAVMLRPAPFPQATRLAELRTYIPKYDLTSISLRPEVARLWSEPRQLFDHVEPFVYENVLLTGTQEPRQILAARVTAGLLHLLGARPLRGRLLSNDDARAEAPDVAMLGEALWRSTFASSPAVIGSSIRLENRLVTVIGVLPRSFKFPSGVELLMPWRGAPRGADGQEERYSLLARLERPMPPSMAQARVDEIAIQMKNGLADSTIATTTKLRFLGYSNVRPETRSALWVLVGAVVCVLLIACANAANLLLARGNVRRREFQIRAALGAGRARLLRQVITESVAFAVISGTLGAIIAYWGVRAIVAIMPPEIMLVTYTDIGVDGRVAAFSLALTIVTGLAFGLGPALKESRQRSEPGLTARSVTAGQADRLMRRSLVVAEFALSTLLLAGAGLLINSFARLASVDVGMDVRHLVHVRPVFADGASSRDALPQLVEALGRIPGVRGVTVTVNAPTKSTFWMATALESEGASIPVSASDREMIVTTVADTTYHHTLGIPIVAGRSFSANDLRQHSRSAIIDTDLARRLFGDVTGIGKRFRTGPKSDWYTVVGIAADSKPTGPDDRSAKLALYTPLIANDAGRAPSILVRTTGDPEQILPQVRQVIRGFDPNLPVERIESLDRMFAETTMKPRFFLTLMSLFAGVALILAAVGVYGVMAYTVSLRSKEIGVRMALGARSANILRRVLGEGLAMTALGAAIGIGAALALSRLLRGMLFEVAPNDPTTMVTVIAVLATVATIAALVPALRASRVSPTDVLRAD